MSKKLLIAGLIISATINLVAIFTFGSFWHEESRRRHVPPPPAPAVAGPEQKQGPADAGDGEQALQDLKDRFHLTDVQMDTMRVLHKFRGTYLRPVRDRLDRQQAEMLTLLQAPKLNQARIDSLLKQVIAAQDSVETGALGVLLRLRNNLTPDQLTRLPELFADLQQAGQQPQPGAQPKPDRNPPPPKGPDSPLNRK
jgi:Spy/CpxP family protein refolding chaperone